MLPSDEENVAKTLADEVCRFAHDFLDLERDAQNGVFTGKAAIGTGIDALVGKIKRSKEAHGASEVTPSDGSGFAGH